MTAASHVTADADDLEQTLIGQSKLMRSLRQQIRMLAPTAIPVLIEGPTGSGKELVAEALHSLSGRKGRFLAINVSAVPESLFESSFFGHIRGSFTGAVTDQQGMMSQADNGSLFLDEIGTLSPLGQAKLLRAIETREFTKVGAECNEDSSFRLLAATNEQLEGLVAQRLFRADLHYRIRKARVAVPALAERSSDIPELVAAFVRRATGSAQRICFKPAAMAVLQSHTWPGNVRELRTVVELLSALRPGCEVDARSVEAVFDGDLSVVMKRGERRSEDSVMRELVEQSLREAGGDTLAAAQDLGMSRAHLYRVIRKLSVARASSFRK